MTTRKGRIAALRAAAKGNIPCILLSVLLLVGCSTEPEIPQVFCSYPDNGKNPAGCGETQSGEYLQVTATDTPSCEWVEEIFVPQHPQLLKCKAALLVGTSVEQACQYDNIGYPKTLEGINASIQHSKMLIDSCKLHALETDQETPK